MRYWANDLLHFWFHTLKPRDWFGSSQSVDAQLRRRYGRLPAALGARAPREFLTTPRGALAAVLLFDQLPRNLHRDDPRAFACDGLARAICRGALAKSWDAQLTRRQRHFLYMPLMHSEAIADQLLALKLFSALGDNFVLQFARSHYRMIARFGRYPHRNRVLDRRATHAEQRAIDAGNVW